MFVCMYASISLWQCMYTCVHENVYTCMYVHDILTWRETTGVDTFLAAVEKVPEDVRHGLVDDNPLDESYMSRPKNELQVG